MSDRDRLVELIKEADDATEVHDCDYPTYEKAIQAFYTSIADHLLANGVIVLPCAVGDEYWCTECDDGGEGPVIHKVHSEPFACFVKDLWGIKCFATKEEAEAKLKELQG